jgi:crossover junction endodeoxyribonuclease RusA
LGFFFERPERAKSSLKTTKPDIDKLQRAALDALTGVLFEDDSQVVSVICTKDFGSPARMMARVWTVG